MHCADECVSIVYLYSYFSWEDIYTIVHAKYSYNNDDGTLMHISILKHLGRSQDLCRYQLNSTPLEFNYTKKKENKKGFFYISRADIASV